MTPEEAARVEAGFQELVDTFTGPYAPWLLNLYDGYWRFPEVTPDVMKAILLACLSPDRDNFDGVCRTCGLCCPTHRHPPVSERTLLPNPAPSVGAAPQYGYPEFFLTCPHCGIPQPHDLWTDRVLEKRRRWMNQDGYAGPEVSTPRHDAPAFPRPG